MPPQTGVQTNSTDVADSNKIPVEYVDTEAQSITRNGSWEYFRGERIHSKEFQSDDFITGHKILTVRTFKKDTNVLKQEETYDLFDTANACISYHEILFSGAVNEDRIYEIQAEYNDSLKTFVPVIIDIENKKYVGDQIANFLAEEH